MNKLEEQLRASRRTEVPDLQPPSGGWEAISGKLAAEAAVGAGGTAGATGVGSAVAGTTAKAILLKWLAGLGGLLLVSSVTVYLMTAETESIPDSSVTTELVEAVVETEDELAQVGAQENLSTQASARAGQPQKEAPIALEGKAVVPEATKPAATPKQVGVTKTVLESEPSHNRQSPPSKTIEKGVIDETIASNERDNQPASSPSIKETVAVTPQPEVTSANGLSEANSQKDETEPSSAPAPAPASAPEPTDESPQTPQSDQEIALEPTALTPSPFTSGAETGPAKSAVVKQLAAAPFLSPSYTGVLTTRLLQALPEPRVDLSSRQRNGKPRARAEWQLHGSTSRFSYQLAQSNVYERDPTEQASNIFQLPGGETIYANFLNSSTSRATRYSTRLSAGIDRQTSSGFLFHSSIGLYHTYTTMNDDATNALLPDQILVSESSQEWTIPAELGIHYTFRKRRRLRPYLGINLFSNLVYTARLESNFSEALNNQTGLVSGREIFQYSPLSVGLSATTGIQYKITSKWSMGGFLWLGADSNTFLEAPFGLELRYTLK